MTKPLFRPGGYWGRGRECVPLHNMCGGWAFMFMHIPAAGRMCQSFGAASVLPGSAALQFSRCPFLSCCRSLLATQAPQRTFVSAHILCINTTATANMLWGAMQLGSLNSTLAIMGLSVDSANMTLEVRAVSGPGDSCHLANWPLPFSLLP